MTAQDGPWHARGLPHIVSAPVDFDGRSGGPGGRTRLVPAAARLRMGRDVGRGRVVGRRRTLAGCPDRDGVVGSRRPARADALGRVDAALWGARAVLAEAATLIDRAARGPPPPRSCSPSACARSWSMPSRSRWTEADAALGPAPLVADAAHARRVADLHLYLRQHHGSRDVARIGRELVELRESR